MIVCLLWGFLGLVVLWVLIQHQRDRAHMKEAQRLAAERNRARQNNPPADPPDKKPQPKRYFGEP